MKARQTWLRAGLLFLVLVETGVGAWQYFFPRSFFADIPTVALDPPYNQHLMSDVGGLTLAITAVVAYAAIHLEYRLVCGALLGYVVFAVTHVLFHATHLDGFGAADAVALVTGLGVLAVVPVALLVLARRIEAERQPVTSAGRLP
ncbi:MAG TPA: hypothetical protein VJX10_02495 [Pseudonocardiaceae bacterium]|nr:hypothetical protein [Pseudonocardiaceae bacterium]